MQLKDSPAAHLKTILDTRRAKKDGSYPLKIRITYTRVSRFYAIEAEVGGKTSPVSITLEEWDDVQDERKKNPSNRVKQLRQLKKSAEDRAKLILQSLDSFSFDAFEHAYLNKHEKQDEKGGYPREIEKAFEAYITFLKSEDRHSTATSYQTALNAYQSYKKRLSFHDITPAFLKAFEKSFIANNGSITTVGIYARTLRTIINQAIEAGVIKESPFGKQRKGKYEIPTGRNIKKALTKEQLSLIFKYKADSMSSQQKAVDFWIFSYLGNGINMKDICLLRWKDIKDESITFTRAKTIRTKREPEPIVVPLLSQIKDVINRWGNVDKSPNAFVFDLMPKNPTSKQERDTAQNLTKLVNKYMKRLAEELGIEVNLTTYVARHSFATNLKRSGFSIAEIGEALGHSSDKTTRNYLDSFDLGAKKKMAESLINFDE